MGSKLLWTGLTLVEVGPHLGGSIPGVSSLPVLGAVVMVIGCVLMWLDK